MLIPLSGCGDVSLRDVVFVDSVVVPCARDASGHHQGKARLPWTYQAPRDYSCDLHLHSIEERILHCVCVVDAGVVGREELVPLVKWATRTELTSLAQCPCILSFIGPVLLDNYYLLYIFNAEHVPRLGLLRAVISLIQRESFCLPCICLFRLFHAVCSMSARWLGW